jgi:hypothetical protein
VIAGPDGCYGSWGVEAARVVQRLTPPSLESRVMARPSPLITDPPLWRLTGVLVTTGWRVVLIDGCPVTATAPATSRP